jgi:hypothetical protein
MPNFAMRCSQDNRGYAFDIPMISWRDVDTLFWHVEFRQSAGREDDPLM